MPAPLAVSNAFIEPPRLQGPDGLGWSCATRLQSQKRGWMKDWVQRGEDLALEGAARRAPIAGRRPAHTKSLLLQGSCTRFLPPFPGGAMPRPDCGGSRAAGGGEASPFELGERASPGWAVTNGHSAEGIARGRQSRRLQFPIQIQSTFHEKLTVRTAHPRQTPRSPGLGNFWATAKRAPLPASRVLTQS